MAASTVYCHVLEGNVTVVSDISGNITNVVCPHFSRITHGCLKKTENLGFIGTVIGKVADQVANTRAQYCEFGDPHHLKSLIS